MTIKVNGPNGYQEQSSIEYRNSTAQEPVQIMCIVEDPQGVKSYDISFSDNTVDTAYCGGGIYNGNFLVGNLPSPVQDTLSGSSGKVPTKLWSLITISGYLTLATKPPGEIQTCYPANDTTITLRCDGKNWSSNPAESTTTKYLEIKFNL